MTKGNKKKVFIKHSNYLKIFKLDTFGETKESFEDNPKHIALINEYKYGDSKNEFYQMYRKFIRSSDIIKDDKKDDLIKLLNNGNLKKLLSKNDILSLEIKDKINHILTMQEKTIEEIDNNTEDEKNAEKPIEEESEKKKLKEKFKNPIHINGTIKTTLSGISLDLEMLKMRIFCR